VQPGSCSYARACRRYGQTGAGKTHTMMGAGSGAGFEDESLKGIIPRAVDAIFDTALRADSSMEYNIKVTPPHCASTVRCVSVP